MISVYIVYFNNEAEVIPLRLCENYTDAEKTFESTTQDFINVYYADADRNQKSSKHACEPFHPVKVSKYEEGVNSSAPLVLASLKADTTFPSGILFVRKRYEACVYEKICYPGSLYNSYVVKYLGRISVLMQDLQEHTSTLYRFKEIVDSQEIKIARLEAEIKRLEYSNAILDQSQKTDSPQRAIPMKANSVTIRKMSNEPLLDEIKRRFETGERFGPKHGSKKVSNDNMIDQIMKDLDEITGNKRKID